MDRNIAASRPSLRQTQRPLLHRILIAADLDLKSTAQTSVLSRRWRSIWKSSLTKLDFNIPQSDGDEWNSFVQFLENVMLFHNREYATDLEVLSMSTDDNLHPEMFDLLGRIFAHGLTNRVQTVRIATLGRSGTDTDEGRSGPLIVYKSDL